MKGKKKATTFIIQYKCVEINLYRKRFNIEIYQKRAFYFSRISETLYKYFLQIELEEEGSNFLLALIALTNSRYSNFGEFLKIMKNALPLMGKFLSITVWFPTTTFLVAWPNANRHLKLMIVFFFFFFLNTCVRFTFFSLFGFFCEILFYILIFLLIF